MLLAIVYSPAATQYLMEHQNDPEVRIGMPIAFAAIFIFLIGYGIFLFWRTTK